MWASIGGLRQNWDKLVDLTRVLTTMLRPSIVKARLMRLQALGHCEALPSVPQLLIAARDQLTFNLGADTREFYRAQGIPWGFHNVRRFVAFPTTMMDPVGFYASKESIIQHLLQTFHRHATYDMVLLCAHEGGLDAMQGQLDQLAAGEHPHQRSLESLVEDGSYHDRLRRDLPEFVANPKVEPRPIPDNLVPDPHLMLAMDQFKDVRGYTNYAARLSVGPLDVVGALLQVIYNETLGEATGYKIGPKTLSLDACEPELVSKYMPDMAVVTES